jgi:hypothetical protein
MTTMMDDEENEVGGGSIDASRTPSTANRISTIDIGHDTSIPIR